MSEKMEPCFQIFYDTCRSRYNEENRTLQYLIEGKFLSDNSASKCCGDKLRPLHVAAAYGKTRLIKLLLDNGSRVNVLSKSDKKTALHRAVHYNRIEAAKLLLQNGADVTIKDANKTTAFGISVLQFESKVTDHLSNAWVQYIEDPYSSLSKTLGNFKDNFEIQKVLLAHGCQITDKSKKHIRYKNYCTLCKAILDNDIPTVQKVIKGIKDVDYKDVSEVQPLLYATLLEKWDIVTLLLEKNADMKKVFDIAIEFNKEKILEKCLAHGSKKAMVQEWSQKALQTSCEQGYLEITKLLINYGFTIPEKKKRQLLSQLCLVQRVEVLEYLLRKGIVTFDIWKPPVSNGGKGGCAVFTLFCQYSTNSLEKWISKTHNCSEYKFDCSFIEYVNKMKLLNYKYATSLSGLRLKGRRERTRCECSYSFYDSDEYDDFGASFGYDDDINDGVYCSRCGGYKGYDSDFDSSDDSNVDSDDDSEFLDSDEEKEHLNKDIRLREYREELKKLDEVKISARTLSTPSQSLQDFIFFNPTKAARFSRNENLAQLYKENEEDFQKVYPYYGCILNRKYQRAIKRETLMDSAEQLLQFALGTGIPRDLSEEIFQYFTDTELKKIKLSQRLKSYK